MGNVVVAGSQNDASFCVVDFTNASAPHVATVNPGLASGCQVDADGHLAAVGAFNAGNVVLYDISNPASPLRGGTVATSFAGIGAISVDGSTVAVGELNGNRVALIDASSIASPSIGTAHHTPLIQITSIALAGSTVYCSGPSDNEIVIFDFASGTQSTFVATPIIGPVIDSDGSLIAVGDPNGTQLAFHDAQTHARLALVNTTLGGISAIALSGSSALAGSTNDPDVALATSGGGNSAFDVGLSGSTVAFAGNLGACGEINGNRIKLITTAGATVGSVVSSPLASIATIALTNVSGSGGGTATSQITVTPAALAFGGVHVGASKVLTLSVHNPGTGTLHVSSISTTNGLYVSTPASFSVAPGGTQTVQVRFTPNAAQSYPATITLHSDAPAHPTLAVPVTGVGGYPNLSLTTPSVDFGPVTVCLGKSLPVWLANSGPVDATVSASASGAGFGVTPASLVVAAGSSRDFGVRFAPPGVGPAAGALLLSTDDPAHPSFSVPLTGVGTPTPPPAIAVSPTTLAFGDVPVQYFLGLRLTVTNTSPCAPLTVELSVPGAPWFLTGDADPTSLAPTSTSASATIAGGQSQRFVLVYAPNVEGPSAPADVTITSNDPAHPQLTVPLTANAVLRTPAALELVLDRSGSMGAPAPGGTKMDALKHAVDLFADLVILGQGDEMGTVEFDDAVDRLTARAPYDAPQRTRIEHDAGTLTPRNFTAIGGGLQRAEAELAPTALARKVVVVFTDGLENSAPFIGDVEPGILSEGIEVYAVALGQPQNVSAAALSTLAASSGGRFFLTDDTLVLRKNFVQVLADAFRHNTAADPIVTLDDNQLTTFPVSITACERRITFIVNWEETAGDVALEVEAPDGTRFSDVQPHANVLARYGRRPGYAFAQIAFPEVDPGSGDAIGPPQIGTWTMRMTARNMPNGSTRATTSVVVESELELRATVQPVLNGHPLEIDAQMLHDGVPLDDAKVTATVTAPLRSLASVDTPAVQAQARDADQQPIETPTASLVGEHATEYVLTPQQVPGKRGTVYRATHENTKVDGVYHVELHAVGKACGGRYERYASLSVYVGPRPERKHGAEPN